MKCPDCKEVMEITVKVEIRMPSTYECRLSKRVINKKECQITAAFWNDAKYYCQHCNKRYRSEIYD